MRHSLHQQLNQLATERWARRGVRRLVRAVWLSLCVWCIGLGGHLLWAWPLRTDLLGVVSLAIIGGAVVLLLAPKLSPRSAARRLDQRFHLDEQLATAVEVAETRPPAGSIAARLVAESSRSAELLRRRLALRPALPWQDLLTLAALGLVVLGLWIIAGAGAPTLAGAPLPLPGLAAPDDPAQQFPQEQQGPQVRQAQRARQAARAWQAPLAQQAALGPAAVLAETTRAQRLRRQLRQAATKAGAGAARRRNSMCPGPGPR